MKVFVTGATGFLFSNRPHLSFVHPRNRRIFRHQKKQIPDSRIVWPPENSPVLSRVFAQNIIEIAATPERVWSLLIDCVQWPSWYKHCTDVSMLRGGPLLSAQSKFRFKTLGFYFEPDIETFEPFKMLIWSAKGPAGTRGAHAWYIERKTGGCRVITEEAQRGLLLAFIGGRTRRTLLTSHEEWLRALKVLAEKELGPQMPVESFTSTANPHRKI